MLQAAPEAIHFKRILNFGEGQGMGYSETLTLNVAMRRI